MEEGHMSLPTTWS